MFQSWQRADVISALALVVSGLALLVSLAAARYSALQAGVARRQEQDKLAEREPVIDIKVGKQRFPGIWDIDFYIRNRIDEAIICDRLCVREPRAAKIAPRGDYVDRRGVVVKPKDPPDTGKMSKAFDLDLRLEPAGSGSQSAFARHDFDRGHVDALVSFPPTLSSKRRANLTMSVTVRRSIDSVPFAEIIVVTKMPTVSTSKDT